MRKTILELNAMDAGSAKGVDAPLQERLRRRAAAFGSASMLFYDKPLEFVRGEGCWLYDANGVAYLDAYNNVPSVGHCHPDVVAAASRQLGLLNVHNRYLHPAILDYAEALLATLPRALSNVTFTCTGSESNDLAVRLAARFTGGNGVIVTDAAYHGNTSLLEDLSPSSFAERSPPAHVRTIPPPHPHLSGASVEEAFAANVAAAIADLELEGTKFSALMLDSIFSSDGVFADPPGLLQTALDVVHRAGGVLIADEIQPGFGRTGTHLWGFARHGVVPDIVTLGKPMGNGYPMAAVVTRPEILDAFCRHVGYFNTFGGSAVAAVVGSAVLEVIEREQLMQTAGRVGHHLMSSLAALRARHEVIGEVRGAGLYIGIELIGDRDATPGALTKAVIGAMRDRGVLIGAAGRLGQVLKIRPPLCFSISNADRLVAALDESLAQTAAHS